MCSCRGWPIVLQHETAHDTFRIICQIVEIATKLFFPSVVEEIRERNVLAAEFLLCRHILVIHIQLFNFIQGKYVLQTL